PGLTRQSTNPRPRCRLPSRPSPGRQRGGEAMSAARRRRSRIDAAWPVLTMPRRSARIFGVRILILLTGLKMGGAERNVVALMPRLRDLGAEVTLCTLSTARDGSLVEEFAALRI